MLKSLYGLKQASRKWNIKLTNALTSAGYIQSRFDYSMFTKINGYNIVVMLVYVDDLLITRNNQGMIQDLKQVLKRSFMMKDLGKLRDFMGIDIVRNGHGLVLNQSKCALD